jgi:hypothetical protein
LPASKNYWKRKSANPQFQRNLVKYRHTIRPDIAEGDREEEPTEKVQEVKDPGEERMEEKDPEERGKVEREQVAGEKGTTDHIVKGQMVISKAKARKASRKILNRKLDISP